MEKLIKRSTLTKKELCILLQVSPTTLATWLNKTYFKDLEAMGYNKLQRILTPAQTNFIINKLVITE